MFLFVLPCKIIFLEVDYMLNLKAIRLQKGYSVPKFSELTGIHRRTIEDIEKRGDCKISTAYKFAQILGVTLEELYAEKTPED